MMCLLFDFFAAKIHHIYIHWEIIAKYLFPQKCCPIEDKLFIRNAVLSSQMAVFEDKFNLAAPHPDWESNPREMKRYGCRPTILVIFIPHSQEQADVIVSWYVIRA